jgi:hypothetical protein
MPNRHTNLVSMFIDIAMIPVRTLVPHANEINVAATLDTILAALRDLSDIIGRWRYR